MKRITAFLAAAVLILSGCSVAENESSVATSGTTPKTTTKITTTESSTVASTTTATEAMDIPPVEEYDCDRIYGSARHIDGRTLILSIYSDDPTSHWDYTSEVDKDTIEQTLYYLGIATDWISEQVSSYGANAEFIYDWKAAPDLRYEATFDVELEKDDYIYTESVYPAQRSYLYENIDTEALLEKYDADNIIYMFFINSDFSNPANPVTSPRAYLYGDEFYTDHINLCVRFDEYYVTEPSSYAHEILHCFGAYDLYYENEAITAEYVMHCAEIGSNDIMYYVTTGDEIYSDFTELDAYYIGLIDYSQDVKNWYLGLSDYV